MKTKDNHKKDKKPAASARSSRTRWTITIFLVTVAISGTFSFLSGEILNAASVAGAFVALFLIILIGILADILGVAATAADEKPFHSMASRKVPGALEAIKLLRNAEKVASICNDVIGDICGIISGSAAAVIALEAFRDFSDITQTLLKLGLSALVAGLTVGGKACGKSIAMEKSTAIVHLAAKTIYYLRKPFSRK